MSKIELTVSPELAGERADKAISQLCGELKRSEVQKLILEGAVTLNGKPCGKNSRPKSGDMITLDIPEPKPLEVEAQDIPLDIVYEDNDLVVVNKPQGMVVHPAAGNPDKTLVNALLHHCGDSLSGINGVIRPGIVHRIDKDTSGLLIVAKNDKSHKALAEQIKAHSFTRIYEAVVCGVLKQDSGVVDAPIGRHPQKRKQMAVTDKNSKNATTHFEVIKRYQKHTHVRLKLETGRTHQIRVHMAYIGHPVAGDPVYGHEKQPGRLSGQCLHARVIGFIHPVTGKYMEFSSPLPDYFVSFLSYLEKTEKMD